MILQVVREKPQRSHECSISVMTLFGYDLSLISLELPWIPNKDPRRDAGGVKHKSCVPIGVYRLERHNTVKHPRTWALVNHDLDVVHQEGDDHDPDEDRATCLIHVANYPYQLEGCIAVGRSVRVAESGGFMVTHSAEAMDLLRAALPWTDGHFLEISEAA